jgi:hypothetical protein
VEDWCSNSRRCFPKIGLLPLSFDKGIARKNTIDWLSGLWYADPKIKGIWVFMTLMSNKRLFKLLKEDGVWQTIIQIKYVGLNALS